MLRLLLFLGMLGLGVLMGLLWLVALPVFAVMGLRLLLLLLLGRNRWTVIAVEYKKTSVLP